jgi:hypothetical protein
MSQSDEQKLEEDEVVEATSEDSEEGAEVEGHIVARAGADTRYADPSARFKTA